jgi:peptide/nickel transport system substrate-binding protein
MNRILRTMTAAALTIGVAAACETGDREAREGGTVVVVELADIEKPMPLISESSLDNQFQALMYRPLLQSWWEDGRLHYLTAEENPMALVRRWEFVGEDSATVVYHLRTDARWSDGQPVTAHDAAWTLDAQGDRATASPRQDYNQNIQSIEAVDDSTLVVRFTHQYPEMFFHTAGSVAPRHIYEDWDRTQLRNHPAVNNPGGGNLVVSGPYQIASWRRGQQVALERNPHFEPRGNLDRIVFRIIQEETTRLVELQTARVDMISPVPFDKMDLVERDAPHVRFEVREKRFYDYIAYNPRAHDFFADRDIRRALGLAIDHHGLINALDMEDHAIPAGGPYAPIFADLFDPEAHAPLPFDQDEARRILEEKGWTPGPDGILRREGRPFRFTLATNSGNERRASAAQIIQQQWRRIGVDARIQLMETNTFFDRLTQRNYEASLGGWGVGLSPDLRQIWGDPELPFNYVSYDNPETRELIERAIDQPTAEAAAPYWREAAARIVEDQPYTWLYYFDELVGVADRLQGTTINTLSTYQQMWEWHVTDGRDAAPAAN